MQRDPTKNNPKNVTLCAKFWRKRLGPPAPSLTTMDYYDVPFAVLSWVCIVKGPISLVDTVPFRLRAGSYLFVHANFTLFFATTISMVKQTWQLKNCVLQKLSTLIGQLATIHICDWLPKDKQIYKLSSITFIGIRRLLHVTDTQ